MLDLDVLRDSKQEGQGIQVDLQVLVGWRMFALNFTSRGRCPINQGGIGQAPYYVPSRQKHSSHVRLQARMYPTRFYQ